jgi:hypothetical protein
MNLHLSISLIELSDKPNDFSIQIRQSMVKSSPEYKRLTFDHSDGCSSPFCIVELYRPLIET